jgi:hypothetical protein
MPQLVNEVRIAPPETRLQSILTVVYRLHTTVFVSGESMMKDHDTVAVISTSKLTDI